MKHIKPYTTPHSYPIVTIIGDYIIIDISNIFINSNTNTYAIGEITGTADNLLLTKMYINSKEVTRWVKKEYIIFLSSNIQDCEEYLHILNNTKKYNL